MDFVLTVEGRGAVQAVRALLGKAIADKTDGVDVLGARLTYGSRMNPQTVDLVVGGALLGDDVPELLEAQKRPVLVGLHHQARVDKPVLAGGAAPPAEVEEPVVVDFASDEASEAASAAGLEPADFEGYEPSGKGGFTVADVKAIAAEKAEPADGEGDGA